MVPEQLSHEHHATWERRLPWPEAPLMNLPLSLAQAEAFYSFWNSREHRLSQPSHVSFDFGKRFSANSYLNLFWTNRNILNFAISVLRVKSERALASSGSCAHSTRCIPLLCRDLVRKEFTGICLSVCMPVSEHKLDRDARMHPSHRPDSCVFIGSVGRIHAVI